MDTLSYIRMEIEWAHQLLEMVMGDVTSEQAQWVPPGVANPLGAIYAHAILAEDGVLNGLLRRGMPLYAGAWAGKTGVATPQFHMEFEWARALKPDLTALREYAKAVYAETDHYLSTLSASDLDQPFDLTAQGLGERSLGWCLSALISSHANNMAGEISTLKGAQGAKGYPF